MRHPALSVSVGRTPWRKHAARIRASLATWLLTVMPLLGNPAAAKEPSPGAAGLSMEQLASTLRQTRSELEWPGLTVASAAKRLGDPQAALAFVRDGVWFSAYHGTWAGPEGTLRTRMANSMDKALLLRALLRQLGYEAQLVRAAWPGDGKPHRGGSVSRPVAGLDQLNELLEPYAAKAPPSAPDWNARLDAARQAVGRARAALKRALDAQGAAGLVTQDGPDGETAERVPPQWVWVRVRLDGTQWTHLDPVFPERPRPARMDAPFEPKPATVRVAIEALSADGDSTQLLVHQVPAHAVIGHEMVLSFLPADKKFKSLRNLEDPSKVAQWKPIVQVGADQRIGQAFATHAGPAEESSAKPSGGLGLGGGLMGGSRQPETDAGSDTGPVVPAYLRLRVTLTNPARQSQRIHARTLERIGDDFDAHHLLAVHRLHIQPAGVASRMVQARLMDQLVDLVKLRRIADGKAPPDTWSTQRGVSARSAALLNSLLLAVLETGGLKAPPVWQGPSVVLESLRLARGEQEVVAMGQLDVLQLAFAPGPESDGWERITWSLAIAEAEGLVLNTDSVNTHLTKAAELTVIRSPEKLSPGVGRRDGLLSQALASGGAVVAAKPATGHAWALYPGGRLRAVVAPDAGGGEAKGAALPPRVAGAGTLMDKLVGAGITVGHLPFGLQYAALSAYFKELAKAYYAAADKINRIAHAIETGDTRGLENDRDEYFRNLAEHLMSAMLEGGIKGYMATVSSTAIGKVRPTFHGAWSRHSTDPSGLMADSATNVFVALNAPAPAPTQQQIETLMRAIAASGDGR